MIIDNFLIVKTGKYNAYFKITAEQITDLERDFGCFRSVEDIKKYFSTMINRCIEINNFEEIINRCYKFTIDDLVVL
jgi:hypothetical protein